MLGSKTGNHAAFLVTQDATGIWIKDRWNDDKKKPSVSKLHIRRHQRGAAVDRRGRSARSLTTYLAAVVARMSAR